MELIARLRRRQGILLVVFASQSPDHAQSLLLWRPPRKRSGNNRLSVNQRRRPFSLHRLFEATEEESNTYKQIPVFTTKEEQVIANNSNVSNGDPATLDYEKLHKDNQMLREKLEKLEDEVQHLRSEASHRKIILESFEGENRMESRQFDIWQLNSTNTSSDSSQWCDQLEDEACPIEPMVSFGEALRDRALWLVGLLMVQSFSGIILAHNEALLTKHPVSTFCLLSEKYAHSQSCAKSSTI